MAALAPPDPPLTDGVVQLRAWRDLDIAVLVPMANDPEIARWTRLPSPYRVTDALAWFATHEPLLARGEALPLAIADAVSGELVGSIGLRMCGEGRGGIGYFVAAGARRRGIATRALRLLAAWAFEAFSLERLEVLVEPENAASLAVCERAGFTREGVLRSHSEIHGQRADFVLHSLLPKDLE
jgi:RimJ/RimL family protein N-acetyltransferase